MKTKRWLCALIAAMMMIALLPVTALAETSPVMTVEGPKVPGHSSRTVSANLPVLAEGNHARFADRVSNFPAYATDFYGWLVDNACAGGALADPSRASGDASGYYHTAATVSGSQSFPITDYSTLYETASAVADSAFLHEFESYCAFAGALYDSFDRDHPEIFWLNGQSSYSYTGSWYYMFWNNVCTVYYEMDLLFYLQYPGFDVRMSQYRSAKAVSDAITYRDRLVDGILSECPDTCPEDQIRYLNRTLTWNNAYNRAVGEGDPNRADVEAWKCISALEGRNGTAGPVCEGYARAFKVLCDRLEIPCVLTDGTAIAHLGDTAEEHMWNYVQLDGNWYAVDVTWNDPFITNLQERKRSGFESEEWLLLGADTLVAEGLTFLQSHSVENNVSTNGLYFTNGPELYPSVYDPNVPVTYTLSGTVTAFGDAAVPVTVELWAEGAPEPAAQAAVTGKQAQFLFEGIAPGSYTLKVSKADHVPVTCLVDLKEASAVCDVKLCLQGDLSGDGRINVGDVAKLYSHIRGKALITDPYIFACADMRADGRLNVGDTALLYAKVKSQ